MQGLCKSAKERVEKEDIHKFDLLIEFFKKL
jgi:hypothetical protein